MFELNYSKINSYIFCNYLYKFIYIDGKYTKHNNRTSFGISIHKALKDFAVNKSDLKSLLYSYEEKWCNVGYSNPRQMMEYYYKGIDLIKNFYHYEQKRKSKIIYSEDFFEVPINNDFIIRGTVDRVDLNDDGSVNIIDYKLGLDENSDSVKNNLQLSIYAYGISKKYSLKVSNLIYYYITGLKEINVEYIGEEKLLELILSYGKKMKDMVFEKKGNCGICLAKHICQYYDL